MVFKNHLSFIFFSLVILNTSNAVEVDSPATFSLGETAQDITNPLPSFGSISMGWNYIRGLGSNQLGTQQSVFITPSIPIKLTNDTNLVLRPSIGVSQINNLNGFTGGGFNSMQLRSYFSPRTQGGETFTWGLGPYVVTPAGTSGNFGSQQTGAGLSGAAVKVSGQWIAGLLLAQSWSAGGSPASGTVNNVIYTPFIAFTTNSAVTYSAYTQSIYNFDAHNTSNIVYSNISKLISTFGALISYSVGVQYSLSPIPGAPQGYGFNFGLGYSLQ